ncbi:MAG: hypothetical protein AB1631_24465 [Acidobacteriota bacterium]
MRKTLFVLCMLCLSLITPVLTSASAPTFDLCIEDNSGSPFVLLSNTAFAFDDCAGLSISGPVKKFVLSNCDTRYNADVSANGHFYKLRVIYHQCNFRAEATLYEDGVAIRTIDDDSNKDNSCDCP